MVANLMWFVKRNVVISIITATFPLFILGCKTSQKASLKEETKESVKIESKCEIAKDSVAESKTETQVSERSDLVENGWRIEFYAETDSVGNQYVKSISGYGKTSLIDKHEVQTSQTSENVSQDISQSAKIKSESKSEAKSTSEFKSDGGFSWGWWIWLTIALILAVAVYLVIRYAKRYKGLYS